MILSQRSYRGKNGNFVEFRVQIQNIHERKCIENAGCEIAAVCLRLDISSILLVFHEPGRSGTMASKA